MEKNIFLRWRGYVEEVVMFKRGRTLDCRGTRGDDKCPSNEPRSRRLFPSFSRHRIILFEEEMKFASRLRHTVSQTSLPTRHVYSKPEASYANASALHHRWRKVDLETLFALSGCQLRTKELFHYLIFVGCFSGGLCMSSAGANDKLMKTKKGHKKCSLQPPIFPFP
jgi:hypothetical protein